MIASSTAPAAMVPSTSGACQPWLGPSEMPYISSAEAEAGEQEAGQVEAAGLGLRNALQEQRRRRGGRPTPIGTFT